MKNESYEHLFNAKFNYCILIWILHIQYNNRIKHSQERCLLLIYKGKLPFYEDLLNKNGSAPIHYKDIHALADGMFKVTNNFTTKIANDTFYKETKN